MMISIKDIGAIALFSGVLLNAYHYYKMHQWTRKEKNFDIALELVRDLQTIRNKVIENEEESLVLVHKIAPYSHNIEEGTPPDKLCYELMKSTQKSMKIYSDYENLSKFKKAVLEEGILDKKIAKSFILGTQTEIHNRLNNIFVSCDVWANILEAHSKNGFPSALKEHKYYTDSNSFDNFFKDIT